MQISGRLKAPSLQLEIHDAKSSLTCECEYLRITSKPKAVGAFKFRHESTWYGNELSLQYSTGNYCNHMGQNKPAYGRASPWSPTCLVGALAT
jgi:hypothetical protein